MANSDQKLTIQISGNTVELERSLKDVSSAISASRREAGALKDELKFSPGNVELLTKRHQELTQAMELSKVKAEILREDLNKIDPQVDPKGFYKLSRQLNQAEADSRKFGRQLEVANAQLERAQSTAATFKFNTNNGIKEFRNDITGVEAAMASLGGKRSILNFSTASKSVDELKKNFTTVNSAIELIERKSELLKSQLATINPTVNPKGFADVQNKINELTSDLASLNDKRTEIKVALHGDDSAISSARGLGARIVSAITGRTKNLSGDLSNSVSNDIKTASNNAKSGASIFSSVGSAIVSAIKSGASGVASIGHGIVSGIRAGVSGLGSIFNGILNSTVKPFANAIKNTLGTVIQGGLLTIGNAITNKLFGVFQGVNESLNETNVAAKSLSSVLSFNGVENGVIESVTKDMAEFARQTTYSAGQLDKVVAALASSNVEASQAGSLAKSIAGAYSLLGDGSQKISDIGVIFSQINSAGKLMTQDFNQLRNAGIGGALKKQIEEMYPEILAGQKSFNDAMAKGVISAEMVNAAITKIGTSEQAQKAATVPKTMGDAFASLSETIGQKFNGIYQDMTNRGINSVSRITDYIQNLDITGITDKLYAVFDFGNRFSETIQNAISGIDFSWILTSVKAVFDGIIQITNILTDTVKSVFGNIDFSSFVEVLKAAFTPLLAILTSASELIKALFNSDGIKTFGEFLKSSVLGTFNLITDTLSNSKVTDAVKSIGDSISSALGVLSKGFQTIFGDGSGLTDAFVSALSLVGSALSGIVWFMDKLANNETFKAIAEDVRNTIGNIWDAFTNLGNSDLSKIINFENLGKIVDYVLGIIHSITSVISSIDFSAILDAITPILEFIVDKLTQLFGMLENVIQYAANIGQAFIDGFGSVSETSETAASGFQIFADIVSSAGDVVNWLMGALEKLGEIFAKLLPPELFSALGSLLTDFLNPIWEYIKFVGEYLGNFFDGVFKSILDTLGDNPLGGLLDALGELHKAMQPAIDLFNQFLEVAKPIFNVIANIVGKIVGFVAGRFIKSLVDGITDVVKILTWIIEKITGFGKWLGEVGSGIVGTITKFLGLDSKSSDASYSAVSYNAASASYANYSAISNSRNDVAINVYAQPGMDITSLARAVRHEFTVGTA